MFFYLQGSGFKYRSIPLPTNVLVWSLPVPAYGIPHWVDFIFSRGFSSYLRLSTAVSSDWFFVMIIWVTSENLQISRSRFSSGMDRYICWITIHHETKSQITCLPKTRGDILSNYQFLMKKDTTIDRGGGGGGGGRQLIKSLLRGTLLYQ